MFSHRYTAFLLEDRLSADKLPKSSVVPLNARNKCQYQALLNPGSPGGTSLSCLMSEHDENEVGEGAWMLLCL